MEDFIAFHSYHCYDVSIASFLSQSIQMRQLLAKREVLKEGSLKSLKIHTGCINHG